MKTGRKRLRKLGFLVRLLIGFYSLLPKEINYGIYQFIAGWRGNLAIFIRYAILKDILKTCGSNVSIHHNVELKYFRNISIGSNVSIHTNCYLDGYGKIIIGDNVSIAHNCSILSANHTWANPKVPIKYNEVKPAKVLIERDVWLGCGVRVMPGVKIGVRSVIAAGSVVTKDINGGEIAAGIPAKSVKKI